MFSPRKSLCVMSDSRSADSATPCLCQDVSQVVCANVIRYSPVIKGGNQKSPMNGGFMYGKNGKTSIPRIMVDVPYIYIYIFVLYDWEDKHHAVLGLPCMLKYHMDVIHPGLTDLHWQKTILEWWISLREWSA